MFCRSENLRMFDILYNIFPFLGVGLRLINTSGVCFWLNPMNDDKRSIVRKKETTKNSYIC